MKVVVSQREKQPWNLPGVETEEDHLKTGDYTVEGFEDQFAVERKSVNDLATSVGSERERFEAEIRRAQEMDYFVVIIEGSKKDVEEHQYYSEIHPNAVLGTCEKWPIKYNNLEFIWAGNRKRAAEECLRRLDKWFLITTSDLF